MFVFGFCMYKQTLYFVEETNQIQLLMEHVKNDVYKNCRLHEVLLMILNYLIDDDVNTYGHTEYSNALPAAVTIDLGQKVKVSRIVVHARPYGGSYYSWGNPRNFTVYTCDHKPSQSGDWSEWNKIMDCEVIKPSGMNGKDTDEDTEAGQNGAGFSFPLDADPTRYIRLNVTKIWTNNQFCHIAEITVYGDPGVE